MHIATWLGFAVVMAGCGESTWEVTRSGVHIAADAGTDGGSCAGVCVPAYPTEGNDPWDLVALWEGPAGEAPYCGSALDAHYELMVSNDCPACACDPPKGTCKRPETITVHSEACNNLPGSTDMSFDPPADWNGTCNGDTAIPADCGGMPCARSVTIGPMAIVEEICTPAARPIPRAAPSPPTWGKFTRGCLISKQTEENTDHGSCGLFDNCLPELDDVFRYCYRHAGVHACSGPVYTNRTVVYEGYDDHRTCTDCICGPPQGSVCKALTMVYQDAACSQVAGACIPDSSSSCCVDLPSGSALGSKYMAPPTYIPGMCEAMGGAVEGTVEPIDAWTYCCPPANE